MTKPKGVFKKSKFKGNRYYKLQPIAIESAVQIQETTTPGTSQSGPRPSENSAQNKTPVSASKRKLSSEYTKTSNNDSNVNVVFDQNLLFSALTNALSCKLCGGEVSISENVSKRIGLASCFTIHCEDCESDTSFWNSEICGDSELFEINTRLYYGMRCIGKWPTPTKTLCGILNLSPPCYRTKKYSVVLGKALKDVAEDSMKKSVFEAVEMNDNGNLGLDIPVAFDASWQKRGHVSKNACATITSFDTGKVLDVQVLSKYCHKCTLQKGNVGPHDCLKNYDGTSGGMETAAAVTMFQRSENSRGVRYTKFLGDGDSSAFKKVVDAKPYNDVDICKLECIGHVQKRMGSRLRKLKAKKGSEKLVDGKSMKGAGRLTDSLIDKLQDYYGKAIRSNCDNLQNMRKAVWAGWFHRFSTDEKPTHALCDKSWCGFLKAQEEGRVYVHKPTPEAIMMAIKPIYSDLANKDLLSKCMHGRTQNANESFNNVVWSRVPKNNFVGRKVLEMGVWDAVCTFNDGSVSRLHVLKKCGVKNIGANTESAMIASDTLRIRRAEIAIKQLTKEARTERRRKRLKLDNPEKDKDYQPGGF